MNSKLWKKTYSSDCYLKISNLSKMKEILEDIPEDLNSIEFREYIYVFLLFIENNESTKKQCMIYYNRISHLFESNLKEYEKMYEEQKKEKREVNYYNQFKNQIELVKTNNKKLLKNLDSLIKSKE